MSSAPLTIPDSRGRRHVRVLGRTFALALVLMAAIAVSGCGHGSSGGEATMRRELAPTPGPPLPARPGAHVWAVGEPTDFLASANGGASWSTIHRAAQATDPLVFWDVAFADAEHGWAVGMGTIVATIDGGKTWTTQASVGGSLRAVACSDSRHIWAVGGQGDGNLSYILASSDGGLTWTEQHVAVNGHLGSVVFTDSRHGWIVGRDFGAVNMSDFILATTDGGAHWHFQYRARWPEQLGDISFPDERHGWVVASVDRPGKPTLGVILATSDGGAHWKRQWSGDDEWLIGVAFPDAMHGWVVGSHGVILATNNGGKTWATQRSGVGDRSLKRVVFTDAKHGWAIVDKWALLATENGGQTWTVVVPGWPDHITMVWSVAAFDAKGAQ